MNKSFLAGCVIAIALVAGAYTLRTGILFLKTAGSFVEVRGLAERVELANFGEWTIKVRVVANTLSEIKTQREHSLQIVQAFLQKEGFTDTDITILPFSLEDLHSNAYDTTRYRYRYIGTITTVITTDDVKRIDNARKNTITLYEQGINITDSNARYEYTALNDIKPAMLKEASDNAKAAALTFTKDSNLTLGRIQEASQGLFTITSVYGGSYDNPSLYKKIRVVTRVKYLIQQ